MKQAIEDLRWHLQTGGLDAGVEFLNNRVSHRFSAIYKFHDASMNVQVMYDKEKQQVENPFKRVPIANSFCEMAMDQGQFISTDSMTEPRLLGNPFQTILGSYVGVPLQVDPGRLYGTFCHYDLSGKPINDDEFEFLQKAARLLPSFIKDRAPTK